MSSNNIAANEHAFRASLGFGSGSEPTSKWKTTTPVNATSESFIDLLEGRTPLIHEAGFISRETCSKLEAALEPDFTPYLHAIGPQLDKVGVSQFEFQAQSEDDVKTRSGNEKKQYFQAVRELGDLHDKLADKVGLNVFAKVMTLIRSLVPADWEVALATEDSEDEQYFAGIIRGINNGTPIHCDWAPYDTRTEPWAISRVTHQAVFNLCLAPPVEGGGTLIHDVQWSPEALAYRDPNGYGYFDGLVEGRKKAPFQPHAGDLYFFNSRNMHQVFPVAPGCNKRRMAMASFFGVLPPLKEGEKTKLVFWS